MATAEEYRRRGMRAIQDLLEVEHAVVAQEIEAKLADRRWLSVPSWVAPHHLTTAKQRLLKAGAIERTVSATRGRSTVTVLHQPIKPGVNKRVVEDASARKRLLHARYSSWTTGSSSGGDGLVGPGLERVVHYSLLQAAPYGFRPMNRVHGEVGHLLGGKVPGGSMDNAAFLTCVDAATTTPSHYVVLVECKNLREWIYPRTQELHQLLDKAARLQIAHPAVRFVPVLVCRKAYYVTNEMARDLGFYVISTVKQYVRPAAAEGDDGAKHLAELRDELGFDLVPHDGPVDPMVNHFTDSLQRVAERTADRWAVSAPTLASYFSELRREDLTYPQRHAAIRGLEEAAADVHGYELSWAGL